MTSVLVPRSEAEACDIIKDTAGPLTLQGGGTRGVAAKAATTLSSVGLKGVHLYEPGALTLVVAAGTPLAEIEDLAARYGQILPFEPYDSRPLLGTSGTPTIGAVIAANISGPARVTTGAARDFILGLRYVNGEGTAIANGGRVMKNVTGYDLSRLHAGAHGTLGLITQVALKLLPAPEAQASLALEGLSLIEAVKAMSAALATPYGVNGAAFVDGVVHLRLQGFTQSVAYRQSELSRTLSPFGAARLSQGAEAALLWHKIKNAQSLAGKGDLWRISTRPSQAALLASKIAGDLLLDWGGGLIWARTPEGFDLRRALGPFEGHASCLRGDFARFHPQAEAALTRALRHKFDPKGLFNPGLMD